MIRATLMLALLLTLYASVLAAFLWPAARWAPIAATLLYFVAAPFLRPRSRR